MRKQATRSAGKAATARRRRSDRTVDVYRLSFDEREGAYLHSVLSSIPDSERKTVAGALRNAARMVLRLAAAAIILFVAAPRAQATSIYPYEPYDIDTATGCPATPAALPVSHAWECESGTWHAVDVQAGLQDLGYPLILIPPDGDGDEGTVRPFDLFGPGFPAAWVLETTVWPAPACLTHFGVACPAAPLPAAPTPEPSSVALVGLGLFVVAIFRNVIAFVVRWTLNLAALAGFIWLLFR